MKVNPEYELKPLATKGPNAMDDNAYILCNAGPVLHRQLDRIEAKLDRLLADKETLVSFSQVGLTPEERAHFVRSVEEITHRGQFDRRGPDRPDDTLLSHEEMLALRHGRVGDPAQIHVQPTGQIISIAGEEPPLKLTEADVVEPPSDVEPPR